MDSRPISRAHHATLIEQDQCPKPFHFLVLWNFERECGHVAFERSAYLAEQGKGDIPLTAFDAAHVGAVNLSDLGELLLG